MVWIKNLFKKKNLKSPQWLRDLKFKKYPFWRIDKVRDFKIIQDGGWHFSYLQSPQGLLKKIASMSHGEHNKPEFANEKNMKKKSKNKKIFLVWDFLIEKLI